MVWANVAVHIKLADTLVDSHVGQVHTFVKLTRTLFKTHTVNILYIYSVYICACCNSVHVLIMIIYTLYDKNIYHLQINTHLQVHVHVYRLYTDNIQTIHTQLNPGNKHVCIHVHRNFHIYNIMRGTE